MLRPLIAVLLLLSPAVAAATWRQATSKSFIVVSRGSEAELRSRVQELQQFDGLLRLMTGIQPDAGAPPLPVYFVTGRDLRTFGFRNTLVGGFYRATPGGIMAALATDRARRDYGNGVLSVLFHEYTHHFMFQNTRGVYPGWYIEGFAEYLMTATLRNGFVEYGEVDPGRAYQLVQSGWLPMRRVLTVRPSELRSDDDVSAFYAESWLAVHYLSRDVERAKALRLYFADLNRGTKPEAAFKTAFGMDYDQFDRTLQAYLRSSKITKSVIKGLKPVPDAEIAMRVLPPSADTLLVPATALQVLPFEPYRPDPPEPGADKAALAQAAEAERDRVQDRAELLATIRREAARFPDDAYAAAVLAEAEVKLGDRTVGIRQLDALLAKSPDDAQLLYLRGAVGIDEAIKLGGAAQGDALHQARILLAKANKARPGDYRILAAHARTYPLGALPDKEVPVLMEAAELAPQVSELQLMAAVMLARRHDPDGARRLLVPIANNPHGGGQAKVAAALITALNAGVSVEQLPDIDGN